MDVLQGRGDIGDMMKDEDADCDIYAFRVNGQGAERALLEGDIAEMSCTLLRDREHLAGPV